jgi:hypothetical protein
MNGVDLAALVLRPGFSPRRRSPGDRGREQRDQLPAGFWKAGEGV